MHDAQGGRIQRNKDVEDHALCGPPSSHTLTLASLFLLFQAWLSLNEVEYHKTHLRTVNAVVKAINPNPPLYIVWVS